MCVCVCVSYKCFLFFFFFFLIFLARDAEFILKKKEREREKNSRIFLAFFYKNSSARAWHVTLERVKYLNNFFSFILEIFCFFYTFQPLLPVYSEYFYRYAKELSLSTIIYCVCIHIIIVRINRFNGQKRCFTTLSNTQ